MPRRQLLSPQTRSSLFDPPSDPASIVRFYTFPPEDLALIRRRRRPGNRLGFAVQLAYLRHPGRAIEAGEVPPEEMLVFIAQQLGLTTASFADYGRRDQTRREHFLELEAALGLKTFGLRHYRSLAGYALEVARQTDRGDAIVSALVGEVRRRQVILPSPASSSGSDSPRGPEPAPRRTPISWPVSRRSSAKGCMGSSRSRRAEPARASLGCGNGRKRPRRPISPRSSNDLRRYAL